MVGEGLIGVAIGETVAASTKRDGRSLIQRLQQKTALQENLIFDQVIKAQIQKSGLAWTDQKSTRTLELELKSVNLREIQRGYWQINVSITAETINNERETLWSARVVGTSETLRSLDEYSRQPQLFTEDFRSATEDAARQLVDGPIRN